MHEELIDALEKAKADDAGLMLEAWEHLCRTSTDFRRYACTSVDDYGLTVTGRFCRFVDAGAFESAALLMVPEGCGWFIGYGATRPDEPLGGARILMAQGSIDAEAATPALAICIAALRAKGGE